MFHSKSCSAKFFIFHPSIKGTFSNSSTNNSDAFLRIIINKNGFAFEISEYSFNDRANVGRDPSLFIKTENNNEYNFSLSGDYGDYSEKGTVNLFNSSYNNYAADKLLKILFKNKKIRIYIDGDFSSRYSSQYHFSINTKGLKEIIQLMKFKFKK